MRFAVYYTHGWETDLTACGFVFEARSMSGFYKKERACPMGPFFLYTVGGDSSYKERDERCCTLELIWEHQPVSFCW